MDLRTMEPGRLALVEEVGALLGRNVRVVGRASRLDYANARLLLSHRGASVLVDASLLDKCVALVSLFCVCFFVLCLLSCVFLLCLLLCLCSVLALVLL
jgi:hypothetical protein